MSLWQCMGTQRYTGRYYKETLINDSDKVLSIVFTMILTLSTQKSRTPFPLAPSEISNPSHGHTLDQSLPYPRNLQIGQPALFVMRWAI